MLRAILVSVDYSDALRLSLPYNRHHFDTVTVVTSTADAPNVRPIAEDNNADVIVTDLFYSGRGAIFNKWAALEFGLDCIGRRGWLCVMDADILWPKGADLTRYLHDQSIGFLLSPFRRMYHNIPAEFDQIPDESKWNKYPVHNNVNEWAGYSQIFHASDPVLGSPPWHQIDFRTAGAADSFFQAKWPRERKVRPPWHCLHMGPCGINWCGRASPYADGTVPPDSGKKAAMVGKLWETRQRLRREGKDQFEQEKIT